VREGDVPAVPRENPVTWHCKNILPVGGGKKRGAAVKKGEKKGVEIGEPL